MKKLLFVVLGAVFVGIMGYWLNKKPKENKFVTVNEEDDFED